MPNDDEIILAGYDDMGADDDDMGARRRVRRGASFRRLPAAPASRAAARRAALDAYQSDAAGMPLDQMMPFTGGQFTSAVTALTLTGNPQRGFQPRRLIIDLGRVGATSTGLVQVTSFKVGADDQFVSTGAAPASMFSSVAVGIMLKPAAARPGITVYLGLSLTGALTAPDVINVSAAAVGPSIG
jgi:hypothetical protein